MIENEMEYGRKRNISYYDYTRPKRILCEDFIVNMTKKDHSLAGDGIEGQTMEKFTIEKMEEMICFAHIFSMELTPPTWCKRLWSPIKERSLEHDQD